jgi:hypothetical protein
MVLTNSDIRLAALVGGTVRNAMEVLFVFIGFLTGLLVLFWGRSALYRIIGFLCAAVTAKHILLFLWMFADAFRGIRE